MAKKSVIEREKKKEKAFLKGFKQRIILKEKLKKEQDIDYKQNLSFQLQKMDRNSSKTRVSNRCFITGRKRGVYSFFNLAKSSIRTIISEGMAPFFTKSSF